MATRQTSPRDLKGHQRIEDVAPEGHGWLVFSACVLGLTGIMRIIDSIWAFGYGGALPEQLQDSVLGEDLDTFAWVWLFVGVLLLVAAGLVMSRNQLGRWVGVVAAALGGLSALTWMPYYPVWSLMYVLMALLVFYGLLTHGARDA